MNKNSPLPVDERMNEKRTDSRLCDSLGKGV
jgi:hypothetical protein